MERKNRMRIDSCHIFRDCVCLRVNCMRLKLMKTTKKVLNPKYLYRLGSNWHRTGARKPNIIILYAKHGRRERKKKGTNAMHFNSTSFLSLSFLLSRFGRSLLKLISIQCVVEEARACGRRRRKKDSELNWKRRQPANCALEKRF